MAKARSDNILLFLNLIYEIKYLLQLFGTFINLFWDL